MPPKSLNKVQKSISRKAGARKGLHANSRDTHRLQRAADRDARVALTEKLRRQQHAPLEQRVAFFQDAVASLASPPTVEEVAQLIERHLARHDEEEAELQAARRAGRPPSAREALITQQRQAEASEYRSGFWMPDLFDAVNLQALQEWSGLWTGLALVKFVRLDAEGRVRESAFPPRKG